MTLNAQAAQTCLHDLNFLANNSGHPEDAADAAVSAARLYLETIEWDTLTDAEKREAVRPLAGAYWTSTTKYAMGMRPPGQKHESIPPSNLPPSFSTNLVEEIQDLRQAGAQEGPDDRATEESSMAQMRAFRRQLQLCKLAGNAPSDELLASLIRVGAQCQGETSRVVKAWNMLLDRGAVDRPNLPPLAVHVRTSIASLTEKLTIRSAPLSQHDIALLENTSRAWNSSLQVAQRARNPFEGGVWAAVHREISEVVTTRFLSATGVTFNAPPEGEQGASETPEGQEVLQRCRVDTNIEGLGDAELHPALLDYHASMQRYLRDRDSHPKPQHLLLHGPPGTGKSKSAMILARRHGLSLYEWSDGHGLNSELQHQTAEGRARLLLAAQDACERNNTHALVLFDEIHAMMPQSTPGRHAYGEAEEDTASFQRLIDGLGGRGRLNRVFVVGTTNSLQLVARPVRSRFLEQEVPHPPVEYSLTALRTLARAQGFQLDENSFRDVRPLFRGRDLRQLASMVDNAKGAAMAEAGSQFPDNALFLRCLQDQFLRAGVAASGATTFPLPPAQGNGFSAKFFFDTPLRDSATYIERAGTIWQLQWSEDPTSGLLTLECQRMSGDAQLARIELQFIGSDGTFYSARCAARSMNDANTWHWSFSSISEPPGSLAFSDLYAQGASLTCEADFFSFEEPRPVLSPAAAGSVAAATSLAAGGITTAVSSVAGPSIVANCFAAPFAAVGTVAAPLANAGVAGATSVLTANYTVACALGSVVGSPVVLGAGSVALAAGVGYGTAVGINRLARRWRGR